MKLREIPRGSACEQVQRVLSSDYRALTWVMDYAHSNWAQDTSVFPPLHKPAKNTAILAPFPKLTQT